jgi:hypothetical protein
MSPALTIQYTFSFHSGEKREILLSLDENTLALLPTMKHALPSWADLNFHTCKGCPLDPVEHPHCPIAVQLVDIVKIFHEHYSCDEVTVEVVDSRRRYIKETSLQEGLGSLTGIIMVTSGCPVLAPLRPMVRFHLPFASLEETGFRMISMYLVTQYMREKNGKKPDWTLGGLQDIYDGVQNVNRYFANRIRVASEKDASLNAIVILDCFAKAVPIAIKTMMKDYEKNFYGFEKEPGDTDSP